MILIISFLILTIHFQTIFSQNFIWGNKYGGTGDDLPRDIKFGKKNKK